MITKQVEKTTTYMTTMAKITATVTERDGVVSDIHLVTPSGSFIIEDNDCEGMTVQQAAVEIAAVLGAAASHKAGE